MFFIWIIYLQLHLFLVSLAIQTNGKPNKENNDVPMTILKRRPCQPYMYTEDNHTEFVFKYLNGQYVFNGVQSSDSYVSTGTLSRLFYFPMNKNVTVTGVVFDSLAPNKQYIDKVFTKPFEELNVSPFVVQEHSFMNPKNLQVIIKDNKINFVSDLVYYVQITNFQKSEDIFSGFGGCNENDNAPHHCKRLLLATDNTGVAKAVEKCIHYKETFDHPEYCFYWGEQLFYIEANIVTVGNGKILAADFTSKNELPEFTIYEKDSCWYIFPEQKIQGTYTYKLPIWTEPDRRYDGGDEQPKYEITDEEVQKLVKIANDTGKRKGALFAKQQPITTKKPEVKYCERVEDKDWKYWTKLTLQYTPGIIIGINTFLLLSVCSIVNDCSCKKKYNHKEKRY